MNELDFIKPFRSSDELVLLPSGDQFSLPKYLLFFEAWHGIKMFDYGGKPLLDFNGEACFAELAILRLFQANGWEGVWVETYGGRHFLNSMPKEWSLKSEHTTIPIEIERVIDSVQKMAKTSACFDVLVWKGDEILFCEAKRKKKDRLNEPQKRFIQGALGYGLTALQLLIVEWDIQEP
jgi:hypothetical protein